MPKKEKIFCATLVYGGLNLLKHYLLNKVKKTLLKDLYWHEAYQKRNNDKKKRRILKYARNIIKWIFIMLVL